MIFSYFDKIKLEPFSGKRQDCPFPWSRNDLLKALESA